MKEIFEEVLFEALNIFNNIVPNDETFLEENEELKQEIETINRYSNLSTKNEQIKLKNACEHVLYFIDEWFPDSLPEVEKMEIFKTVTMLKEKLLPLI